MRLAMTRSMVFAGGLLALAAMFASPAEAQVFIRPRVFVPGPVGPLPLPPLPPRLGPPVFIPGPAVVAGPRVVPVPPPGYYGPGVIPYGPPIGGSISIRAPYTNIEIHHGALGGLVTSPDVVVEGQVPPVESAPSSPPRFQFQPGDSAPSGVAPGATPGVPAEGSSQPTPAEADSDVPPPAPMPSTSTSLSDDPSANAAGKGQVRSVLAGKPQVASPATAKPIRLINSSKTQTVAFKINNFPFTIKPGESQFFSTDTAWSVARDSFEKNPSEPTLRLEPGDYVFKHASEHGWTLTRQAGDDAAAKPAASERNTETLPPPVPTPPTSATSTPRREF